MNGVWPINFLVGRTLLKRCPINIQNGTIFKGFHLEKGRPVQMNGKNFLRTSLLAWWAWALIGLRVQGASDPKLRAELPLKSRREERKTWRRERDSNPRCPFE